MSSPILPIQDSQSSSTPASVASADVSNGSAFRSELQASGRVLAFRTDLTGPPPEVLEEIAAAGRTNEQMRAAGRQVCFAHDEQSGRVKIELRGHDGKMLSTLSITETLDLAAGKSLG